MSEDKVTIPAVSPNSGGSDGQGFRRNRRKVKWLTVMKWLAIIVTMVTVAVLLGEGCSGVFGFADFACSASRAEKIAGTLFVTPLIVWLLWGVAERLMRELWEKIQDVWQSLHVTLRRIIVAVAALTAIVAVLLGILIVEGKVYDTWKHYPTSTAKDIVVIIFTVLGGVMGTLLTLAIISSRIKAGVKGRFSSFVSPVLAFFTRRKPDSDEHRHVASDENQKPVGNAVKPEEVSEEKASDGASQKRGRFAGVRELFRFNRKKGKKEESSGKTPAESAVSHPPAPAGESADSQSQKTGVLAKVGAKLKGVPAGIKNWRTKNKNEKKSGLKLK